MVHVEATTNRAPTVKASFLAKQSGIVTEFVEEMPEETAQENVVDQPEKTVLESATEEPNLIAAEFVPERTGVWTAKVNHTEKQKWICAEFVVERMLV